MITFKGLEEVIASIPNFNIYYLFAYFMKIPCELVVWYLLPTMRKEVARELVTEHGLSQAKVAKIFGVTDAAISQYLKDKRGDKKVVTENPDFVYVREAISEAAARIAAGESEFSDEVCTICMVAKRHGILNKIYEVEFGCSLPACVCDSMNSE